ncbi:MAG TPA: hypothetical protein VGN27_02850 [Gaiellaceae bacterium]|jgi:hypothetical protein|nr:hypothetical protein [Gaiellaceae bacterium]
MTKLLTGFIVVGALLVVLGGGARTSTVSHVTAKSGSGSGFTKLYDRTLTRSSATIDTGPHAIPDRYAVLTVWIIARTDARAHGDGVSGGTLVPIYVTVNGDNGPHYDFAYVVQGGYGTFGHGALTAQTSWEMTAHGSGGTDYPAVDRFTIPDYASTVFGKVGEETTASPNGGAAGDSEVVLKTLGWRGRDAVNRLTVRTGGKSKLVAGSRLLVYGGAG